jgi:hypothetical protein
MTLRDAPSDGNSSGYGSFWILSKELLIHPSSGYGTWRQTFYNLVEEISSLRCSRSLLGAARILLTKVLYDRFRVRCVDQTMKAVGSRSMRASIVVVKEDSLCLW